MTTKLINPYTAPATIRQLEALAARYKRLSAFTIAAEILEKFIGMYDPRYPSITVDESSNLVGRVDRRIADQLTALAKRHKRRSGMTVAREIIEQYLGAWEEAEQARLAVFDKHRRRLNETLRRRQGH